MKAEFVGHVTYPTYSGYEESAYIFTCLFPDGSVATVPMVKYEPGFHEDERANASDAINNFVRSFEVNEMAEVAELAERKNMVNVASGPLITSDASYYQLRFDPETGWTYEWEYDARGIHRSSVERFKNWAEYFIKRYCNWGLGWPEQPDPIASIEVTTLQHDIN